MYQCVSAGCDIHVQCYGSVTYVCTCVLAGSLLQRTGWNSVERRGVKLMFI